MISFWKRILKEKMVSDSRVGGRYSQLIPRAGDPVNGERWSRVSRK